jgi:hypothetical protein
VDLEVAEEGRLVIGDWAGSVKVSAGSPGIVQLDVRCRGVVPPPRLEVERDGEDVYVAGRSAPSLEWLSRWAWRKAQLAVSVPARYSVEVATHGGRIEIQGVDGEVEARSRGGHLVFRNVRGPIDARTSGGSIAVSRCYGGVDATTSRGAIEIREVEGPVSAHTRSGRIAVVA